MIDTFAVCSMFHIVHYLWKNNGHLKILVEAATSGLQLQLVSNA